MPLSPSERLALMKEIARRLDAEDWSLIDVTLRQFSLPYSDEWNSPSKSSYVLSMIENAPDQSLIALAQHTGFHFEEAGASLIEPPFWHKGMFRLFVTHLSAHKSFAAELQGNLLRFGITCFVAHNDIEPTLEWQTQIETALATSDALVALLHKNFHYSNWTDQEIGFAMGHGIPVFAVRFYQDSYGFIGRFQAFIGNGKNALKIASELFDAFRKNKQTQRKMSGVLIGLFEESESFAEAKTRVSYLEELEYWEHSFSTRIRSAIKNNSQIAGSWGVPNRVENLAKKWDKLV